MVKLLTLVALCAMIALPTLVLAQEGTPVGEKPYSKDAEVKAWTNVKATFSLGGTEVSIPGFSVKRIVTSEPEGQFYYKENNTYWTWQEGYSVVGPTEAKDLGYYTIRYGVTPTPPAPKIYKATPPTTVTPPVTPKTPEPVKTGWKRGTESVRTK